MKSVKCLCVTFVIYCLFAQLAALGVKIPAGFSDTIWLDQYIVLADGSLTHNTGHLLRKGVFQVITTETVDPFYVDLAGLAAFIPISGKPIMIASLFDAYKAQGLIPKWSGSTIEYSIGYVSYVTVTPKGFKPVALKQPKKPVIPITSGKPITLRASATGTHPLTYQWYFTTVPYDSTNTNSNYYSQWVSTAVPLADAKRQTYKIANPQSSDAGDYLVMVANSMSTDLQLVYSLYKP